MLKPLKSALLLLLMMTLVTGLLYPMIVAGAANLCFPDQARGSLVYRDGYLAGSWLIGQAFTRPEYFHGRPSLAGNGYDASLSGASNLGPTSQSLQDLVRSRLEEVRTENRMEANASVPADMVTASASGLDPHISPDSAALQIERVALNRGMSYEDVRRIVDECTEPRTLGFLGESRINVLELNLRLDALDE